MEECIHIMVGLSSLYHKSKIRTIVLIIHMCWWISCGFVVYNDEEMLKNECGSCA